MVEGALKMDLPLLEMRKTVGGADLGKKTRDSLLNMSSLRSLLAIQMEMLSRKLHMWNQKRATS